MISEELYLNMIFGENVAITVWNGNYYTWLIEKDSDDEWDIMQEYVPKGYRLTMAQWGLDGMLVRFIKTND